MEVTKNIPGVLDVPARAMTMEAMQKDFEYEMAQKLTKSLLDQGLISIDEYDRISALNREKFSPFYADLMRNDWIYTTFRVIDSTDQIRR